MVDPFFQLGPFSLRWYTVFLILAIFLPFLLLRKFASRYSLKNHHLDNMLLLAIPAGIVGARLYHVLDEWGYYQHRLNEIFYLWQGGLGIFGGLLVALLVVWYYCRINRISLTVVLAVISPFLLLGQAIGRVGNYFNQEGFGPPTEMFWGVYISPQNRPDRFKSAEYFHPAYFYEAAIDLVGVIILGYLFYKKVSAKFLVAGYLIFYGMGRLVSEYFRFDTAVISGVKMGYLVAGSFVLVGLFLLFKFTTMKSTLQGVSHES